MATAQLFKVTFEVVKLAAALPAGGIGNNAYVYRRGTRSAFVQAASIHPKDLLTVLNNDISVGAGESIEILSVQQESAGSEGVGSVLT